MNRGILVSIAGTVALAAIERAAMFWKARPKDTRIAEHAFHLTLPGTWTQEPSADPTRWSYHTENQYENLTVSLFGLAPTTTEDERSATKELKKYLEFSYEYAKTLKAKPSRKKS